jgi:NAD(P)H-nitrite reductase large subunit
MHVAIIGNGIAGITAARHLRKHSNCRITVVSAETDYFFSRTALMYVYMGHLRFEHTQPYEKGFWKKNRIDLLRAEVLEADFARRELRLRGRAPLPYDALVLACGSVPNQFGWPGQDLDGVQGLYSYQDLQRLEALTPRLRQAVLVGGGLIGVELAEMLHSRHIPVTFLVREPSFWRNVLPEEESAMVTRHIRSRGIDLRLGEELEAILPDAQGRARAVRTKRGEELPCQLVGLTAGVRPNIDFLRASGLELDRGILVDDFLQTSLPGVYAVGDCAQLRQPLPGRRALEPVWYTGRMMGETVARTIAGKPTPYRPGVWFNSAKFFDLEYQTYGQVPSRPEPGLASLYWEDARREKCLRVVYEANAPHAVVGANVLGIRHRHEVWDRWIRERRPLAQAIASLHEANFDPEFFPTFEHELGKAYERQFPDAPLPAKPKRRFWEWRG